jgi:hypothetical protein
MSCGLKFGLSLENIAKGYKDFLAATETHPGSLEAQSLPRGEHFDMQIELWPFQS